MKLTGVDLFLFWVIVIGFIVGVLGLGTAFVYGLKHAW